MILGKKDGALLSAYVEYFREVRLQVFKIVNKKLLNEAVVLVEVEAPFIAKKVLPGQFIIFRIDEQGERVPLTVADYDREKGTITLIVQMVGRTTKMLGAMEAGEYLLDVVGRWASQPTWKASRTSASSAAAWAVPSLTRRPKPCTIWALTSTSSSASAPRTSLSWRTR